MKIPKKVTILGRTFKVLQLSETQIREETGVDNAEGAVNYRKRRISLRKDLPEDEMLITFLHECHHAIDYITGFSQVTGGDIFEIAAESRANGFFDVFKSLGPTVKKRKKKLK